MKSRIVLAGGSGFVGRSISPLLLSKGFELVVLTRAPSHQVGAVRHIRWDGQSVDNWTETLEGAFAVINLTGRSVNCHHTPENRREILESRVNSVRALGRAISGCTNPPKIFVQAAGVGIYGEKGERWCDESASHGNDFLAEVCKQWESAFAQVGAPATRKVLLRLGVVLGPNGGFLDLLGKLTRWFLGGHVSNGRQFISWIHVVDLARMFLASLEREDIAGIFNAVAPNPVTNAEFMRELRHALHRPWSPPVPEFAARIGSWLVGTQADLALVSQRCTPKHFLESGFNFEFPELRPALDNIYQNL